MTDFERLFFESNQGEPVLLFDKKGDRKVGCIIDRKYIKRIKKSHLLTTPPAIAIDRGIFIKVIQPKCDRIFVLEMDSQTFYSTSVANFAKHALHLDRKFGDQFALPLEFWGRNVGVSHQVPMPI